MEIQKKLQVAKALKNYAVMQGYTGKRGKQKYTRHSVAKEFNFSVNIVYKLFSMNENLIDSISENMFFQIVRVLAKKDVEINEIYNEVKEKYDDTLQNLADNPRDQHRESESDMTIDDMSIQKQKTGKSVNMTPEMPSEMHVSNRLYRVEGRIKEIKDATQSWRNHYKDELLAAFTLMESTLKMKEQGHLDPLTVDFYKERSLFVEILDLIIEKLDRI